MKDETRKMVLRIEAKGQTQVILGSYTKKKKKKIMANLMMEVEESEELRMTHIVNFENSGTIHERMKEEHLSLCVSWGKREW